MGPFNVTIMVIVREKNPRYLTVFVTGGSSKSDTIPMYTVTEQSWSLSHRSAIEYQGEVARYSEEHLLRPT